MARLKLSAARRHDFEEANIGHIIIFCEGYTEKYYFDYFAQIVCNSKYNDVQVKIKNAEGDARSVLNYANSFLTEPLNNHIYKDYGKYRKRSRGKIREIVHNGDVELAIDNAKILSKQYAENGITILNGIKKMNPYSNVYELAEQFVNYISKKSVNI